MCCAFSDCFFPRSIRIDSIGFAAVWLSLDPQTYAALLRHSLEARLEPAKVFTICSVCAELNVRSMREWQKLGAPLAEFPGTLYLGDARDNDPRYPSRKLSTAEALRQQPGIAPEAAASGAVLYEQEGATLTCSFTPFIHSELSSSASSASAWYMKGLALCKMSSVSQTEWPC